MGAAPIIEEEIDTDELLRRVMAHFRSPRYQPPLLPVIAVEIMALSQDEDISANDIVAIVERDPLLAAKLLKLAQSSRYSSGRRPVQTLQDAVARLGNAALRDMVFEVSLNTRIFQAQGYTEAMERLRVHSVATAHIARAVCRHVRVRSEYAFLAGLLRDVGVAGLFIALAEMGGPDPHRTWPAVCRVHAEASGLLGSLWRLPKPLVEVMRHHHEVVVDGKANTLCAIVVVAERFAFELAPLVGDDPSTPQKPRRMPGKDLCASETVKAACALLGINGDTWAAIRADAKRIVEDHL